MKTAPNNSKDFLEKKFVLAVKKDTTKIAGWASL